MVVSMDRWVGKVAIITGASAGIGAAIARKLVQNGMIVAGLARRKEKVEKLSESLRPQKGQLHALKCDVSNEDDILTAFRWVIENLGPVHVLVNNAGILKQTNLCEGDTEMWRNVLDTNVMGLCIATREAIKVMKSNNIKGHIIHINSILGHGIPAALGGLNMYSASKHAITALTETLRLELAVQESPIKITSISPGATETEIVPAAGIDPKNLEEIFVKDKMLQGEDIADSIIYVLSTPPHVQIHELTIKPVCEKF